MTTNCSTQASSPSQQLYSNPSSNQHSTNSLPSAPHPPHIYSHNSEGTNFRTNSNIPVNYDYNFNSRRGSTGSRPLINQSYPQSPPPFSPPPPPSLQPSRSQGWNPSWDVGKSSNRKPSDGIQEAIRASEVDAENYRIRRESEAAEEARAYQAKLAATLAYSAEQASLRAARILEAEEAEEIALREALVRSKGKARETEGQRLEREEREEMEMVLALSLSETRVKREGETSAEVFERLSRPVLEGEPDESFSTPTASISQTYQSPSPLLSSTSSLSVNGLQRQNSSFYVANPDLETDEYLPPPAYTIESESSTDGLSCFASTQQDDSPIIQHSESRTSIRIFPPDHLSYSSPDEVTDVAREVYNEEVQDDDIQDPFADEFAEIREEEISDEENSTIDEITTSDLNLSGSSSNLAPLSLLHVSPCPSPSSLSNSVSRGASPLFGGLVDSSSLNADPDDEVLRDVKFGFVALSKSSKHPPLLNEACWFPDCAQLSRSGGEEEFDCFAIESVSWTGLLTYLMWFGNSSIEAAPSDLESTKRVLSCRITLEFFRSFLDARERVRVRLELLPPPTTSNSNLTPALSIPPANFDPDCPNITIPLPQTLTLPFSLATLATTISIAHTHSRQARKSVWSNNLVSGAMSNQHRILKDLSLAIDLFRRLRGEDIEEEVQEEDEDGLMRRLKGRLKRRKKAIELVAGEGRIASGSLPEAALMVTPFRLD